MDQMIPRVLKFDRFTLDLVRGCLRTGDQDIALAPKPFEVIRYLAQNAGRLVPKQELFGAVWPNVIVTDDSLVRCIRELRSKLGHDAHRLIKTVPRRGYLLDAAVTESGPLAARDEVQQASVRAGDEPGPRALAVRKPRWQLWGAAAAVLALVLVGASPATDLSRRLLQWLSLAATATPSPVNEFFTEGDASRVAEIAKQRLLPLPAFRIRKVAADVPKAARRFVGVWVSDKGWAGSQRQLMIIVTHVGKDGAATGYAVSGPPQPASRFQTPAHFVAFKGRITDDMLAFSDGTLDYAAPLSPKGQMSITAKFPDGSPGWVQLDPVWTLIETERAVAAAAAKR
jgi:DNA-binding winged helix-turn-helix (wHTH) protein